MKDWKLCFDEEDKIRCQGTLKNSPFNYSVKFQVLLLLGNYFTDLVINHYHKPVLPNGIKRR